MGRLVFAGSLIRLLLLVACLAMSMMMPNAIVGLGVWPVILLAWGQVPQQERVYTGSVLEFLPFAIAVQVALDTVVPYLGDVFVLIGNAMVVAALCRPRLPIAIARKAATTSAASRSPVASACAEARRAS